MKPAGSSTCASGLSFFLDALILDGLLLDDLLLDDLFWDDLLLDDLFLDDLFLDDLLLDDLLLSDLLCALVCRGDCPLYHFPVPFRYSSGVQPILSRKALLK